ncbi:MAG: glycosyltransferase family 39 protein [Legionella sp.]|uniref:ArnT family glycosyltransferase n=1 Tax=Legionella sp. TaxID=459 RepID=UPI0039E52EE2
MDIKNDKLVRDKFFNHALFALMFLLICRLVSMYFIPLNDVSEARYGEIARKMLETGNWVTLFHDYGVPFWAKPPLSTWLSAASMKLFGVNELAVRLPGLLLSIAIVWLVWDLAKKHSGSTIATLSAIVLSGTLYFFLDAGTVMTDPSLIFCTTLVLVSFWHAVVNESKFWSYLFFVGIGLGLLAKGPVAGVLVGMPLFFWVLIRNQWLNLWKRLPWFKGILLVLAIALPWYILAELRTPGFLNYFIVGEHFHRFVTPGWTGDKYGYAHQEHWGMIWAFAVLGIFPWCFLGSAWLVKYRKGLPALFADNDGWLGYLFGCTVVPLFFFTFSSNIIYTYVFPSLPFFALFFTEYWVRAGVMLNAKKLIVGLSLITGVMFLVAAVVFNVMPNLVAKTQKPVINTWLHQNPAMGSKLVYWDYKTEFSAQFYSGGKVRNTQDNKVLCQLLANHVADYVVMHPEYIITISPEILPHLTQVGQVIAAGSPLLLLRSSHITCS